MSTQLVDIHGQPLVIKAATIPNLDPGFFIPQRQNAYAASEVVDKPFEKHVWTYRCVGAIQHNVAPLQKVMYHSKSNVTKEDHAVLSLINKPNFLMSRTAFFEMIIALLLLPVQGKGATSGGQCFVIPWNTRRDEKVNLAKGEMPDELFPYNESYFEPWYDRETRGGRKTMLGWKFSINHQPGTEIYFSHNEIIRINMSNPYDYLKGMSPFSPVALAIEFDAVADLYNKGIFAKDGRLDGTVSSDQFIPKDELDKMRIEWEKRYTGTDRSRTAFLSGGLKYNAFALSSMELGYVEQEKWTRQKVIGAYGLNRIALGDYEEINYATIREGRKLLWYDRYIPLDKLINDAFSGQWVSYIDNGAYVLRSDYSTVQALQADMQEKAKTGGIMVTQMSFPPSLASRILDIPLREDDVKKWPHLDEPPTAKKSTTEPGDTDSKEVKMKSIRRDYSEDYIKRVLDPAERAFKRDLERFFIAQRNKILDNVDKWLEEQKGIKAIKAISAWELLPDELREGLELMKLYKPNVKAQAVLEKGQIEIELGHAVEWDLSDQRIQIMAGRRAVYLQEINTTTFQVARDAIGVTVSDAMEEGLTPAETARKIKQAVQDVYKVRLGEKPVPSGKFDLGGMSSSTTIARTEMGSIATMTRADIFKSEGVKKIQWISAGDEKVRPSHNIDEVIELGSRFSNGLLYPREQGGPAGEVINCRCAFIAISEED